MSFLDYFKFFDDEGRPYADALQQVIIQNGWDLHTIDLCVKHTNATYLVVSDYRMPIFDLKDNKCEEQKFKFKQPESVIDIFYFLMAVFLRQTFLELVEE